jgi:hypothetical protein
MKKRPKERRKVLKGPKIIAAVLIVLGLGGWWLWPDASPATGGAPKSDGRAWRGTLPISAFLSATTLTFLWLYLG